MMSNQRLTAFLLCSLLGVFGFHRFYAGRNLSAYCLFLGTMVFSFGTSLFGRLLGPSWSSFLFLGLFVFILGVVFFDFMCIVEGKFKDKNRHII